MSKFDIGSMKSVNVKLLQILCGLASVQASTPWELSTPECRNIQRFRPKSIILQCPMLSMINKMEGETVSEHCRRAGCCYTKHKGSDLCWLNGKTFQAQRQTKLNMRQKEESNEKSQLELIKEHQQRQKELAIIALEEAELKREEEQIQETEQEAINQELEKQRLAALSRNNGPGEGDDDDGEHRAFQLIHFGAGVEANNQQATRMDDGERCLANIEYELNTKGRENSCVNKVDFAARVACDVQEIRALNQDMSLCSACVQSGCCFDSVPRLVLGRLVPMCFYHHQANVAASEIEEDLMQSFEEPEPTEPALTEEELFTEGIMKQHGHATAAPDMMGVKYQPKRDNRYSEWIRQNYNIDNEEGEESTMPELTQEEMDAASKMQELLKNNPRLAGKLGHMGISTSQIAQPSANAMGTSSKPAGLDDKSDRLKSLLGMYGSNSGASSKPAMPSMTIPGMGGLSSSLGMQMPGGSSSSASYMDKIKQQFLGGSGSSMPSMGMPGASSNPMSMLGMLGGSPTGSATSAMSQMDKIKQMLSGQLSGGAPSQPSSAADMMMQLLNKKKEAAAAAAASSSSSSSSSATSSSSSSSSSGTIVAPEPEPEFTSAMHANMYKQMMQSFKLNLSRMNKSPMAMQKDLDTFKRTVLKRFDKYLVKTTTPAPVTTPSPDFEDLVEDEGENKQIGSAFDYGSDTANFIPFDFERFMIGNDEPNNCYPQECGVPELDSIDYLNSMKKIVGGTTAGSPAFWPWQVSIRRIYANTVNFSHLCGGTLISSKWIITAAHCFIKYTNLYYQDGVMENRIDQYMIHVGRYHKSDFRGEEGLQMRTLEKYIAHENFSPTAKNQVNDIALAKMLYSVKITEHVKPVCLPSSDTPPREGDRMWITGWGDDMNIGPDNEVLKELSLPVASVEMCKNDWKSYYNEGWICSDRAYKEDACTGDSGGPAVHKTRDGRWRIVGITAAGSMKCSTTQASIKAGVFTNVAKFRQWIDTNTGGMC